MNLGARKPVLLVELVELARVVKESHFSEQIFGLLILYYLYKLLQRKLFTTYNLSIICTVNATNSPSSPAFESEF